MRSIKYWRLKTGLTQAELAMKIGSTQPCISNWEEFDTEPKLFTLRRMAHIFGVDAKELMTLTQAQEDELEAMEGNLK